MSKWIKRTRRRIEAGLTAPWVMSRVGALAASRIRHWHDGISWEVRGRETLSQAAAEGPVILAVWHGRLAMTPFMWDLAWGPICSITSKAPPGRMVGATLERFGWQTVAMHDKKRNSAVSLQVARRIRDGMSIGIACDGPLGPARKMKTVPLEWARLSGAPIWLWSYSVEASRHMRAWDRMILPRGRGRGVMLYEPWSHAVPKRPSPEEVAALRVRLEADLDALTLKADREMGHPDILC